jgi:ribose-phosphate pyrophosphokinase
MDGLSVPAHGFKLIAGPGNPELCGEIAQTLDVPFCKTTVNRFADGEIFVRIDENVRGNDVFIVQPTNPPAENIMELLLLIDAARRASAARITCVMPYYGYSRQDRKDQPRVAIGAKLLANMITVAGANRVLGIDFHQHQLQGFFDVPVDHLYAAPVFVSHYRKKDLHELVVVAPDVGSAKMARGFAKRLNGSLAIVDKRRPKPNVSEVVNVVGEVEGKEAAIALKDLGARDVYVCATHALLSGPAVERLSKAPIKEVTVTDTVMIPEAKRFSNLRILSVGELLSKAIRYIQSEQSVSSLFEG